MNRLPILLIVLSAGCVMPVPAPERTTDAIDPGAPPARVDRMGRVEVSNFMLCFKPFCKDDSIKDTYDAEDPFDVSATNVDLYRGALEEGLERLDGVDSYGKYPRDWTQPHPLIPLLLQDFLVVDVAKPCTVDSPSYLSLELAAVTGTPTESCGGRTPNDDVIDRTLTLMINGPTRLADRRSDGVDSASSPATQDFPYLAAPHGFSL